ncbi:hypothetical protein CR513_36516, partial [Mucuna pruriens]
MASMFESFTLIHVPQDQNEQANLLASRGGDNRSRSLTRVYAPRPSTSRKCVNKDEVEYIVREVHKGICGTHIGGRALANKIAKAGRPQSTPRAPAFGHIPMAILQRGVDILGPFPVAPGQLKFLIVAIDYFTKWVEAELVATISSERIKLEHPQSNSQAEAANKVILRGLRKCLEEAKGRWADELP